MDYDKWGIKGSYLIYNIYTLKRIYTKIENLLFTSLLKGSHKAQIIESMEATNIKHVEHVEQVEL